MTRTFGASYGLFDVTKQEEGGDVALNRAKYLFNSGKNDPNMPKTDDTATAHVRAVVYLKPSVQLKEASNGTFDIK